jgi:hypothetical protein
MAPGKRKKQKILVMWYDVLKLRTVGSSGSEVGRSLRLIMPLALVEGKWQKVMLVASSMGGIVGRTIYS